MGFIAEMQSWFNGQKSTYPTIANAKEGKLNDHIIWWGKEHLTKINIYS